MQNAFGTALVGIFLLCSVTAHADDAIGVSECDDYIANYDRCLKRMPRESQQAMGDAFSQMKKAWKQAAATAEGKRGLVKGCLAAQEAIRSSCPDMESSRSPAPIEKFVAALSDDGKSLGGVRLGWKVADLNNELAVKEQTEQLDPKVRGIREFSLLPSSLPVGSDKVSVLAKDNKVFAVVASTFVPTAVDRRNAGTYSALVSELTARYGRGSQGPTDESFLALLYGHKAKAVTLYETMAWETKAGPIILSFSVDPSESRRWYTLVLLGGDSGSNPCKARQSEARVMLKAIYTMELAYQGQNGKFLDLPTLIRVGGLDDKTISGARYYEVDLRVTRDGDGFTATASDKKLPVNSSKGVGADSWTISDKSPSSSAVSNACE